MTRHLQELRMLRIIQVQIKDQTEPRTVLQTAAVHSISLSLLRTDVVEVAIGWGQTKPLSVVRITENGVSGEYLTDAVNGKRI